MRILVFGSLAYDRIMSFPGRFSDHILPDKLHVLSVCFVLEGLQEKFGGTAGNIAYSLSLLGDSPTIVSSVGKDFEPYAAWLAKHGLTMQGIRRVPDDFTAGAYITTDQADNQITAFNPGAMRTPAGFAPDGLDPARTLGIVAPGCLSDMKHYSARFKELGIPFFFDPGQNITAFSGEELQEMLTGADYLITNDYELELILKATGLGKEMLLHRVGTLITTLGEKGCLINEKGQETAVPAARVAKVADPTGAGDSFRAGLMRGIAQGRPLPVAARMGAVCAAYCVEQHGTQEHAFTQEAFWARYEENFGKPE
ncbi:Adenosine kinase [Fundidesulfovibrio magnetotacticus]|uniref:Adenosine kinase n=1 Tax=Fundidesulfovibrio magnetotacticus TaxID=2730080 RepID=A0A6V8LSW8_9BACT|nr:carbohydrate kinase family protein [Fundidesulfovibrio magnetotacticus]GFK93179.1 Adenosine kinase [Fundidesulfovibrio magnetotacticus]